MSWFDGKKTVIGSICLALAVWLPQLGIDASWVPTAVQWLSLIGTVLGGVGVAHKVAKGELSGN